MSTKKTLVKVEITHKTILFILFILAFIWFLLTVRDIVLSVFIAILVSTAVNPLVSWLEKHSIPRSVSAAAILVLIFVSFTSLIVSLVPLVVGQITMFLNRLPILLLQFPWLQLDSSSLTSQLAPLSGNLLKFALNTFSGTVFLVTTLFISYYMIQERERLDEHLAYLFGNDHKDIKRTVVEIENKLGHWVRGELFLMFIVGLMTYIGLAIIDLDYILPLALIAGLLEAIPNLGPTFASIPAVIVGFSISPLHGALTIVLYILIQQLENNLIVPQIMRKSVGLHPVATIVALMIGFRLGGAVLAILSLPLLLAGEVIFAEYYKRRMSS